MPQGAAERNYRLLEGFAGDILIQNALADRHDRRNLIFPAPFCYRHYLELVLKALIEDHGAFAGVALGTKDHKLPELWQLFVKTSAAFGYDCSDKAATAVAACIDEFVSFDADSTTFRYAQKKNGDIPALPSGLDIVRSREVMNGIANFFECIDMDFSRSGNLTGAACASANDSRRIIKISVGLRSVACFMPNDHATIWLAVHYPEAR